MNRMVKQLRVRAPSSVEVIVGYGRVLLIVLAVYGILACGANKDSSVNCSLQFIEGQIENSAVTGQLAHWNYLYAPTVPARESLLLYCRSVEDLLSLIDRCEETSPRSHGEVTEALAQDLSLSLAFSYFRLHLVEKRVNNNEAAIKYLDIALKHLDSSGYDWEEEQLRRGVEEADVRRKTEFGEP